MAKKTKIDLIETDPEQKKEKAHPGTEPEDEGSETNPLQLPNPGNRKKTILILALVGLVFLGGAAFASLRLGWISIPGSSHAAKKEPSKPEQPQIGVTLKLSPLVINLKEESGRHYLKVTVVLELSKKDGVEEVTKRMSSITDTVLLTLSDKQLQDLKRPESKDELKKELMTKINQLVDRQQISQIYFDEFLYQ
jgi:flagellar protein FliL